MLGLLKVKYLDREYTFQKYDVHSKRQEQDTRINPETRQEKARLECVKLNLICKLNANIQDLILLAEFVIHNGHLLTHVLIPSRSTHHKLQDYRIH